jgi:hypothetical protein
VTTVLATYHIKGGVGKISAAVETAIPAYEMPWGDVRRRLAEYPSRPV